MPPSKTFHRKKPSPPGASWGLQARASVEGDRVESPLSSRYLRAGRMESPLLGRKLHFMSPVHSLGPIIQGMLVLSVLCRNSLLFTLAAAAASVSPHQDHMKFGYNRTEWSDGTNVHSTPVKCLVQQTNRLQNETFGDYRLTLSIGDGIYIFGFIGILIVLKSLLTKIMMVENKPEDTEYVMSETPVTYKIRLQKCTDNNNVSLTPPNSPCPSQPLSPSVTGTPMFYSGTRCCPLSHLGGGHYYGERCPFSSPEGSTKSLV